MANEQTVQPDGVDDRNEAIPSTDIGGKVSADPWAVEDPFAAFMESSPPEEDDDEGDEAKLSKKTAPAETGGNEKEGAYESVYQGLPFADEVFGDDESEAVEAAAPAKPAGQTAGDLSLEQMVQYFPGQIINSPEDLRALGLRVVDMESTLRQYDDIIERNPDFAAIAQGIVSGKPLIDSVREIYPWARFDEPSKDEDPDQYVQAQLAKSKAEEKRQRYKEQTEAREKELASRQAAMQASFNGFAQRHGLDEQKAAKAIEYFKPFIDGRAQSRGDFFDILWKGVNADKLIEQAKLEGRNEVLSAQRSGKMPKEKSSSAQRSMKTPLPLPHATGSRGEAGKSLTTEEKELRHMQSIFSGAGNW